MDYTPLFYLFLINFIQPPSIFPISWQKFSKITYFLISIALISFNSRIKILRVFNFLLAFSKIGNLAPEEDCEAKIISSNISII